MAVAGGWVDLKGFWKASEREEEGKRDVVPWRSHLRPQLMRNRSAGSTREREREGSGREYLYSVPHLIDSFALALF